MATKTTKLVQDIEQSDRISHCLTTFSHVVTVILSYLNARDLNRCSRVCTLWLNVAKKQKRLRQTRAWTCLIYDTFEEESVLVEKTKDFFRNLYTEPKTVFMFYQTPCYDTLAITELCQSEIPPDCEFVGVASGGIIGTTSDLKQTFELEDGIGISILCLPHYDGVDIVCAETEEDEKLDISSSEQCKALLTLSGEPGGSRQVCLDLMKQFTYSLVAGGYVDNIIQTQSQKRRINKFQDQFIILKCAALCGSRVEVASVILKSSVNTPGKVEEVVKKLKSHNLSEANSFAFMFACIGRGAGMYGESNIESSIFRKHFPNTPLFGFFGNGEIGFDFVSRNDTSAEFPEKKKRKSSPKLHHAYTTILVLVSIT